MSPEPFSYTNSKGVKYYLNEKAVTLRGGKEQLIRYFTKDIRPEALYELPAGLAINENPRNGFLTVRLVEQPDAPSCEDDCVESGDYDAEEDDCDDCCGEESTDRATPNNCCECDDVCEQDCCEDGSYTDFARGYNQALLDTGKQTRPYNAGANVSEDAKNIFAELKKYSVYPKTTMRRCLVEQLKSAAETPDGRAGEDNTITVTYEYGDNKRLDLLENFTEITKPTSVRLEGDVNSFAQHRQRYNKLELQAHIKNLQTILNTLQ